MQEKYIQSQVNNHMTKEKKSKYYLMYDEESMFNL